MDEGVDIAKVIKSRTVYAKILLQIEQQSGPTGVRAEEGAIYAPISVSYIIYSDEVLKVCNLVTWGQIKKKRTIVQWDLGKSDVLKTLRVSLTRDNTRKGITLKVNRTGTTLEEIAKKVLALKTMKIGSEVWQIKNVTIPPEKIVIFQPDAEPEAPPSS